MYKMSPDSRNHKRYSKNNANKIEEHNDQHKRECVIKQANR